MKLITPKYVSSFKCIAGACTDSCCIGWEINIDKMTREKYRRISGTLGERLKREIEDTDEGAHIRLSGERCPFLNSDNLCDIIIALGEENLCEICREHPRYYTVLGECAYSGIGLSCEAAAKLILSEEGRHDYVAKEAFDIDPEPCDGELFELIMPKKQTIVDILLDKTLKFSKKLALVQAVSEKLQAEIDGVEDMDFSVGEDYSEAKILGLFESLEYLGDTLFPRILQRLTERDNKSCENEKYLINLLIYFVDRYFPSAVCDGDVIGKMTFAALSTFVIGSLLSENSSLDEAIEISKEYSKEIEYNEENVEKIEECAYSGLWHGSILLLSNIT